MFGSVPRALAAPDTQAIGQTLFYLINNERARQNLPPLTTNPLLKEAAQKKADDMLREGYFEHTSPEGRQFYTWVDETGYKYTIVGENLAANLNTIDPEKMVESWMGSTLHRQNILSPQYSETGFGVAYGTFEGKEAVFAVESFAHPVTKTIATSKPTIYTPTIISVVPVQKPKIVRSTPKITLKATPTLPSIETVLNNPSSTTLEMVAGTSTLGSSTEFGDFHPKNDLSINFFEKCRKIFLNFF